MKWSTRERPKIDRIACPGNAAPGRDAQLAAEVLSLACHRSAQAGL